MTAAKVIAALKQLRQATVSVESSIGPKGDWGGLVNVDATLGSMQKLHGEITAAAAIGPERIEHILCDGPAPKIELNEAPIKYADRAKRWCSGIRDRLSAELQTAHEARAFFWTRAGGLAGIAAIVVAIVIWLVSYGRTPGQSPRSSPSAAQSPDSAVPNLASTTPSTSPAPKRASPTATAQQNSVSPRKPTETSEDLNLTYEEFVKQYRGLDERPFEQAEFLNFQTGKKIQWIVTYAGCYTEGTRPVINFRALGASIPEFWCFIAFVNAEKKGILYGLKEGQRIEVTGTLTQQVKRQLVINPGDFRVIDDPKRPPGK